MLGMTSGALSLLAVILVAVALGPTLPGFLAVFLAVAAITAVMGMRDRRIRARRGPT
jgi:hypothetical protein